MLWRTLIRIAMLALVIALAVFAMRVGVRYLVLTITDRSNAQ